MLHIEAQITVKKEQTEAFLQAAKEVIAASRAETGNHGYELVQSVENETVFYMLEKWAIWMPFNNTMTATISKNSRNWLLILLLKSLKFQC